MCKKRCGILLWKKLLWMALEEDGREHYSGGGYNTEAKHPCKGLGCRALFNLNIHL